MRCLKLWLIIKYYWDLGGGICFLIYEILLGYVRLVYLVVLMFLKFYFRNYNIVSVGF